MRRFLQILSWIALAATVLPSVCFLGDAMADNTMKATMLLATIAWFAITPFWMGRTQNAKPTEAT